MAELLSKLDGGELIGLVAVLGGLLTAVIAVITAQWRRVRQAELQADLVQQMLERGMSAVEIEQILKAAVRVKHGRVPDAALRQWSGGLRPD